MLLTNSTCLAAAQFGNTLHCAGQCGVAEIDRAIEVKDESVNVYSHTKDCLSGSNMVSTKLWKLGEFAKIFTH